MYRLTLMIKDKSSNHIFIFLKSLPLAIGMYHFCNDNCFKSLHIIVNVCRKLGRVTRQVITTWKNTCDLPITRARGDHKSGVGTLLKLDLECISSL